ncbi:hypothetical protein M409DRAFT_70820 [Zasmidium cellare ATCC 36951]|uniref:GPI anchored protein n=1 Tax=Zasmidium cellare ATCC 36951 TaxID=1080233 RepID=A0A6A6BYT4_ZASCE|nr:uncharacterized protein M409DRAFT_70820 [Zasmidium cellare ATCC 36951]KAF2159773.1 hypothetical protein M409DRAFT_70820 [Zasmidium cellare ATCC 36951]
MKELSRLFALPASLVALTLSQCAEGQELQWPHNLPRTAKYYPEHEAHVKRGLEAQERLQWDKPAAVKKMGQDPGEKFYLDYWQFAPESETSDGMRRPIVYDDLAEYTYSSSTCLLLSPLAPHTNHERIGFSLFGRGLFTRDFECPANTVSCSNINSDLCCNNGETCVNTSNGVGCCPSGATCGNNVAGCDTAGGYTSCPDSDTGGCCVPGARCLDTGCVFYGTQTVTTTLPTATATTGTVNPTTMSSETSDRGTTVIVTSGYTTTVTISGDDNTVTTTVVSPTTIVIAPVPSSGSSSTSSTCTSGFFSCASEDGGGCCRNGQSCQSDGCKDVTTTTTATASAPFRPTSGATTSDTSISAADTTITTSTTPTNTAGCPTGFYMCSAVYLGGCCRVDRNCDTTSCPTSDSTEVITSGLTIAVTATTDSCANGWSSCAASDGGGCCPTGFACGSVCVTSSGDQTQTLAKESPSSTTTSRAAVIGTGRWLWTFVGLGLTAGVGMICL